MCLAVLSVYCPTAVLDGSKVLYGHDFFDLHTHRIRYAQQALSAAPLHVPGWHSRELLGAPFWSNPQNFPFIPTRLLLLCTDAYVAFEVGVNLAALLSALFTFLYARQIGLGRVAAAVSGWTFACAGYFASRLLAGHLPLLEAYPALPLLLWLIELHLRASAENRSTAGITVALGLAATCTVLAGHPQLPFYALVASLLYLVLRGGVRVTLRAATALLCGVGAAAFVLYPMFLLIQRSTRVLRLDEPINNVYFPYERLLAFLRPWHAGGPQIPGVDAFQGYADNAFFWDTVCYVGWLPIAAVVFFTVRAVIRRAWPTGPWLILAVGGAAALLLAMPFMQHLLSWIPGTILRSPSRQLYLTTFALALGLGAAVDTLMAATWLKTRWGLAALVAALVLHYIDLRAHAAKFLRTAETPPQAARIIHPLIRDLVGGDRIAIDSVLKIPWNRDRDDVGFFDSIMLARPYQALLAMSGAAPGVNLQHAYGSMFNARTLAYAAVHVLMTDQPREQLTLLGRQDAMLIYQVPNASRRVHFLPQAAARFLGDTEIMATLRNQQENLQHSILLEKSAESPTPAPRAASPEPATVKYQRPSSDMIVASVRSEQPGYLRILETWDPGWRARVDGKDINILRADYAVMAIPLGPGTHEVQLEFATPGARTGQILALVSFAALLAVALYPHRAASPRAPAV